MFGVVIVMETEKEAGGRNIYAGYAEGVEHGRKRKEGRSKHEYHQ